MEVVKDSLSHGENVYLRGFGSFIIKTRSEKTARNISKKTTIIIPEHKIPAFKPARVFMDEVKTQTKHSAFPAFALVKSTIINNSIIINQIKRYTNAQRKEKKRPQDGYAQA